MLSPLMVVQASRWDAGVTFTLTSDEFRHPSPWCVRVPWTSRAELLKGGGGAAGWWCFLQPGTGENQRLHAGMFRREEEEQSSEPIRKL